ncbi:MAG: YigZ family protein [Bacteroidales bacterium]|nr:YigZ family protein [Bacteroidales bacterium]
MKTGDTYKTIRKHSQGLYKAKGSKFISFAFPVSNEVQVEEHLESVRKKYHDARHHCYAWALGYGRTSYKINDDGEPSGTAGKPIYGQIRAHDLTNLLIVVLRYFGGTKLGIRGLINAYKGASIDALTNNVIITETLKTQYRIVFDYLVMNEVMQIMKEYELEQRHQDFGLSCTLVFSVRQSKADVVLRKLNKIKAIDINML